MFIAHAPSGYILSVALLKRRPAQLSIAAVIAAGIVGALAPDIDLAYFYLVDGRQVHHHRYMTHWPLLWGGLIAAAAFWRHWAKQSSAAFLMLVFGLGGLLHLVLDTLVGAIWWFAPFVDQPYALFVVPARFKPWWLSFFLHWTFIAELVICLWAALLYRRRCRADR